MNAYGIDIWRSVKHNDKFSHNVNRFEIIHARNEAEAKNKVTLAQGYIQNLPALQIEVSNETIYSIKKIGTVKIEKFYVYSDGRTPRPVRTVGAMK